MTHTDLKKLFSAVWLVDFEFYQPDGERPVPLCLVAMDLLTGRTIRVWNPGDPMPPYGVGPNDLFVAYYATAELGCHIALKWPMPVRVIDLYAEFRRHVCGRQVPSGHGLLGALAYFGLPGIENLMKEEMRKLAQRGGPYTADEQRALVEYCETDVIALQKLLPAILPHIDLPRALIRGEYMAALAHIEWRGVPVDTCRYDILKNCWQDIKLSLIERIDRDYCVYEDGTFKRDKFRAWLVLHRIPWPMLESGEPALDEDTFKDMAKLYPLVSPLKELRATLGQLRLNELRVGRDGRNRCLLSPFASTTSRNQPSNTAYIFGPAVWIRSLIKPASDRAVAYVDWEQQEFGIAAFLSRDAAMMDAYRSGDPYLAFAKQAGAVPADATKQSHKRERDLFKNCALAVQYGMGEVALGFRLGLSPAHGRELLGKHRSTYPGYWRWSDAVQDHAMFHGVLQTTFGWRVQVGHKVNPRSLRNFPIQANGAEMLRLAVILTHRRGVQVSAPVHDALLIEATVDEIDEAVLTCQKAMADASELVLPGFPLRTDTKVVRYPERYSDERGTRLWDELWSIPLLKTALDSFNSVPVEAVPPAQQPCFTGGHPSSVMSPLYD